MVNHQLMVSTAEARGGRTELGETKQFSAYQLCGIHDLTCCTSAASEVARILMGSLLQASSTGKTRVGAGSIHTQSGPRLDTQIMQTQLIQTQFHGFYPIALASHGCAM